MSAPKLLTYPGDFRAFKGLIAAQYAGVAVETDANFEMGKSNTTKEFMALSPLKKVPVLVTEQGPLLESNSIARYFARQAAAKNLMGTSFFAQAQVDSWLDWCSNELELPVTMWVFPIFGFMPPNPKAVQKAKKDTTDALKVLEKHLLSRSYLVGEAITLADIVLASALVYPMKMVFDINYRKQFPCITRWFLTCTGQAEFNNVVGDVVLCTKAMELPKPKKKEPKKKAKKAAAAKPKAAKKPARKKHPLDELPKSTFVLDSFKKQYSNSKDLDTLYKTFDQYFCDNFDPEGWSIWFTEKQVNEDPTAPENIEDDNWKVSNGVGGLVSRYDAIRKWCMGIFHILDTFAEDKRYPVEGLLIMRGQEEKYFDCNPEYNLYNFRKCDWTNAADKKRARDIICAWDNMGDKPVYDSKVFK